jgi:ribonuclease VapC
VSEWVLDASALLAYLNDETGAEVVEEALGSGAYVGVVNWAEVLSKTAEEGGDPELLEGRLEGLGILGQTLEVMGFTREEALTVARLRPLTKALGLSLGDRACLALARRLSLPALTADRSWGELSDSLVVHPRLIR